MGSEILTGNMLENGSGYEITFLGKKMTTTVFGDARKSFQEAMRKLETAYDMVPEGASIIPTQRIKECQGYLVGGILQDSLYPVFGVATDSGLSGYACSIYWVLSEKEIEERSLKHPSLPSDLMVKGSEI